jgi:hypothetical protein
VFSIAVVTLKPLNNNNQKPALPLIDQLRAPITTSVDSQTPAPLQRPQSADQRKARIWSARAVQNALYLIRAATRPSHMEQQENEEKKGSFSLSRELEFDAFGFTCYFVFLFSSS